MRIGILGGGQLARMLALAGYPLGFEFVFLCPDPHACAAPLGEHLCAEFNDQAALQGLVDDLYGSSKPRHVVDELISQRRLEARNE